MRIRLISLLYLLSCLFFHANVNATDVQNLEKQELQSMPQTIAPGSNPIQLFKPKPPPPVVCGKFKNFKTCQRNQVCAWDGQQCVRAGWQCFNGCTFSMNDGVCDDGGQGSESNWCPLGSDCADCGIRINP